MANLLSLSYTTGLQTSYRTLKNNDQNLGDHGFVFRQKLSKMQFRRERMDKLNFVKINFCSMENTVK
jgi:hypothetical protein